MSSGSIRCRACEPDYNDIMGVRRSRFCLIAGFVLVSTVGSLGQEKKSPEKVIELPILTTRIAAAKLTPIWKAQRCGDGSAFYIISYGNPTEVRRRRKIIVATFSQRCDFDPLRVTLVDGPDRGKPTTVVWRVAPGVDAPVP